MAKSPFALISLLAFSRHQCYKNESINSSNKCVFFVTGESTQQQQSTRKKGKSRTLPPSNLPQRSCFGYIENNTNYKLWKNPEKIPCTRQVNNLYGNQWGPSDHQKSSCCTGNGRYWVQTSRIGGFDILPSLPLQNGSTIDFWDETIWEKISNQIKFDPVCQAYTSALQATLCDPAQGRYLDSNFFVSNTMEPSQSGPGNQVTPTVSPSIYNENITDAPSMPPSSFPSYTPTESQIPSMTPSIDPNPILRICRRSCNKVFEKCGLPGENFPQDAGYSDGESFCYQAWGGWYKDGSCDAIQEGFPCQSNLGITIVNDDEDCLDIVEPTQREIDSYIESRKPPVPEECANEEPLNLGIVIGIIVGSICAVFMLGGCIWIFIRKRQMDVEDIGELY